MPACELKRHCSSPVFLFNASITPSKRPEKSKLPLLTGEAEAPTSAWYRQIVSGACSGPLVKKSPLRCRSERNIADVSVSVFSVQPEATAINTNETANFENKDDIMIKSCLSLREVTA